MKQKKEDTKEYQEQAQESAKEQAETESVEIKGKGKKETPKEIPLIQQIAEMPDLEYRTMIYSLLIEILNRTSKQNELPK